MVSGLKKYFSILLLAVYLFFFASANLFYHTHIFDNTRIVHSHPFSDKAHNHTSGQIQILEAISQTAYDNSETLFCPDYVPEFSAALFLDYRCEYDYIIDISSICLRAPPAYC